MKRSLSLLLSLVFCLSLASCKKPPQEQSNNQGGETPPEIIDNVCNMSTDSTYFKTHGRTSVVSEGLACDASASGIEFNAYIEGDLKITLNISQSAHLDEKHLTNESYFTLYIDGVRSEERIHAPSGESTLTLASFEQGAVHNIKLIKQTEAHCALCTIKTVSFRGYFEEKPADKELLVEFIGDSITVGYGNLCTESSDPNRGHPLRQDATKAYAYLTAEKLGADASLLCCSGMGIAKGYRPYTANAFFSAASYYRNTDTEFLAERIPDIVVINLGTNDQNKNPDYAELRSKVIGLINLIRTKYGNGVPIVWIHGMMGEGRWSDIQPILNGQFKGEQGGIYTLAVPSDNSGGGGHPGLAAHASYSDTLAQFIKDKGLAN